MINPRFQLTVERYINAPPETVYKVCTERLEEWWAPKPWTAKIIEHDLRPGGRSAILMTGPHGETESSEGVILEVVPNSRIVFTDAFTKGWIPQKPFMVGFFEFTAEGDGTRYCGGARHWDEATLKQHESMGFREGWSTVAEQLAELAEADARKAP